MQSILIVEDDLPIQYMYRFKLESAGFDVHVASNGKEGLEKAAQIKPHLIMLDLRMPEMNGDEMLSKLREHTWGANIRVVILTNLSKDEAPSVLRFLSVDRYIVKAHYTPAEIVRIVEEVVGKNE